MTTRLVVAVVALLMQVEAVHHDASAPPSRAG
jgi:hypothetical protein